MIVGGEHLWAFAKKQNQNPLGEICLTAPVHTGHLQIQSVQHKLTNSNYKTYAETKVYDPESGQSTSIRLRLLQSSDNKSIKFRI